MEPGVFYYDAIITEDKKVFIYAPKISIEANQYITRLANNLLKMFVSSPIGRDKFYIALKTYILHLITSGVLLELHEWHLDLNRMYKLNMFKFKLPPILGITPNF